MHIHTITCSDPREDTPVSKLVDFMNKNPDAEIAVQATPSKIAPNMPRHVWFEELLRAVRNNARPLNLAMHLNMDYCHQMCRGDIPMDLINWILLMRHDGGPVIKRWQLNFSGSKTVYFDYDKLTGLIKSLPEREFIMQHDGSLIAVSHLLHLRARMDAPAFSVLYDASGGNGISPTHWHKPFQGANTGYSGGLRPENIKGQLDKIASVANNAAIWIDAEGGLKKPGTKTFDIARAQAYVNAARHWNEAHGR